MTISEVYEDWKQGLGKQTLCKYGEYSGGPGYFGFDHCEIHDNVRYGRDLCPKECSDFINKKEDDLFHIFLIEYSQSASYYNQTYNIDPTDRYYRKS